MTIHPLPSVDEETDLKDAIKDKKISADQLPSVRTAVSEYPEPLKFEDKSN